jgi:serine protease Do
MTIERYSFRLGLIAGLLLMVGLVAGLALSSRLDWMPRAVGAEAAPPTSARPVIGPSANFVPVVKAVTPAVVNISTTRVVRAPGNQLAPFMDDPFFRQFFGDEFFRRFQIPRERRENSLGSGVIVSDDGYIVTNNHVIAKADEIKVLLNDGREFTGKIVGTDPKTDIAVIKIDAKNLPVVPWGNSDELEVGEYVLAIGNPFGLNSTVTMGIVSATGRANVGIADYEDFIQTDAAINPGNSGGALVNARGELVGINTAIFSRSGGYMGIGFAVPANMARAVMRSLIETGKVTRGWLGVSIQEITPDLARQFGLEEARGALVSQVLPGTPAAEAGLQAGDVIVAFDGRAIEGPVMLRNVVAQTKVGRTVKVEVVRDKRRRTFEVTISEQPKDMGGPGEEGPDGEGEPSSVLRGLELRDLTPEIAAQLGLPAGTAGVVVTEVEPDSPAGAAGVQPGDVILEINRTRVRSLADVRRMARELERDEPLLLLLNRRGSQLFLAVRP